MTPEDVALQLLLLICLAGSALFTTVRACISSANLQQLEDDEHLAHIHYAWLLDRTIRASFSHFRF